MRDIKFRAKSLHDGNWVYGLPVHYNSNPRYEKWTIHEDSGIESDIDEETLGQFTGWKPRHCDELYDGDIIEFDDWAFNERQRKKMKHHIGVIRWSIDYGKWVIECKDGDFEGNDIADPKLLGNIYDNPELL